MTVAIVTAAARRRTERLKLNLVVDGNSISANHYTAIGTLDKHIVREPPLATMDVTHSGHAVSGHSWTQMLGHGAAVDAAYDPARVNVLTIWENVNALYNGATVADCLNSISDYTAARRASHPDWRILYIETLPYGGSAAWTQFNTDAATIDATIRANPAAYGIDATIGVRGHAAFNHDGTSAAPFQAYPTFWQETAVPFVHPKDPGKAVLAPLIAQAVADLAKPATTTGPFNAATTVTIPTPDGTGSTIHPSVVDMGAPWNGYRYWLADTPYPQQDVKLENPCIYGSHDGLTWQVPPGLTNPIDPWPGGAGYNSDTELVYDPENDRLVCYWRDYKGGTGTANLIFCASTSINGSTWTPQQDLVTWDFPSSGAVFSPAVVRVGPTDWRMWALDYQGPWDLYRAPGPLGPWEKTDELTFAGTYNGGVADLWHGDIIRTADGVYRAIANAPRGTRSRLWGASSLDGVTWSGWSDLQVGSRRRGEWDKQIYRATLVPAGSHMRVWYSAYTPSGDPRVGHTRVPLTEWPPPPVT